MAKVYYVYDALCGWCYGFSPVIKAAHESYSDHLEFEVISGGMVRGERVGPISDMADYIRGALKRVEEVTGTKFGEAFAKDMLDKGDAIQDSLPPARLLSAVKDSHPKKSVPFAAALQKAIYFDGIYPTDLEKLSRVGEELGIQAQPILEKARTEAMEKAAEEDFARSQAWGVRGFPTIIGEKGGQHYLLTHGATTYEDLSQKLDTLAAM